MEKQEPIDPPAIETRYVVALREALLEVEQSDPDSPRHESLMRKVDIAAAPLVDRCFEPLLHYCDSLARSSASLANHADGDDIAQDAWAKSLRYLKSDPGARVKDDTHFLRFLYATAKSRFLDIRRAVVASTDKSPSLLNEHTSGSPEDVFSPLGDDRTVELIELLFTDEYAFRKLCRTSIRRKLVHYRAYVLYQLGHFLFSEGVNRDTDGQVEPSELMIRLMRQYTESLGIPALQWLPVEETVLGYTGADSDEQLDLELAGLVNRLFGSAIKPGNNLSVLRHELNAFVSG